MAVPIAPRLMCMGLNGSTNCVALLLGKYQKQTKQLHGL
jgi:hypothetical protein